MANQAAVPTGIVVALRRLCLELPEAHEEEAWTGTRWRIRGRTFAHVLFVDGGWPPAYARAAGTDGPATVLTFRSAGPELEALRHGGPPFTVAGRPGPAPSFFAPRWRADEVGLVLDDGVDWDEVAELLTDSYCLLAPRRLAERVVRPPTA